MYQQFKAIYSTFISESTTEAIIRPSSISRRSYLRLMEILHNLPFNIIKF
jgi:hypothetical protein